jgi:hypothetical protein
MLTYAVVLIVVMIATYNPAIKSRVNAFWSKIKPKTKKKGKAAPKAAKKKAGKEEA